MEPLDQPSGSTSSRRSRNAASQRLYRARQKARLEQLERLAVEAVAPSVSSGALAPASLELAPQLLSLPGSQIAIASSSPGSLLGIGLSSYDIRFLLTACSEEERKVVRWIIMNERFSLRDLIKFGLIQSGYAMDLQIFENAQDVSARSWLEKVKLAVPNADLKVMATAGIRLLARMNVPWDRINRDGAAEVRAMSDIVGSGQSSLHSNRVLLSRESLAAAMFANASHLHIPIDDVVGPDAEYPTGQQDDAYRDLVPTASQITIPHHPCFDTLPWPLFRSNICLAISHDPPLIDDDELCLDMMNDGIRCWGSSKQSLSGRGDGVPWDSRSWEAAPWFLEKWEPLTGGRNSEMWMNSAWWRYIQ
ncbi:hypothetical protein GQ53DRAFT_130852 [Thozetella sp. PMI_491]|nr:hypothetical protein GQ53DRAFT_130852 [Thozetella sp. PMI_491]